MVAFSRRPGTFFVKDIKDMSGVKTALPAIQTEVFLQSQFEEAGQFFPQLTLEERLLWAYNKFGRGLVLTSSFGVQSLVLLNAIKELRDNTGINIPVICVDIKGSKYDGQRAYRDLLQKELGFDLHVFLAEDEATKVETMDMALAQLGVRTVLSGIRASQTETRRSKRFIEENLRNGIVEISPLLDWPDVKVERYLQWFPVALRHPEYAPGAQSKGGVPLGSGQEKTECGLHL